jgi:hypothetical protein
MDRTEFPVEVEFSMLASGAGHTCGMRLGEPEVICWGDDSAGQATGFLRELQWISAFENYTCGVEMDDTIFCWGNMPSGAPTAATFSSVSAGGTHACGLLKSDSTAQCWGTNTNGQASPPAVVSFEEIQLGLAHSCGIRETDGEIQCWGANNKGQSSPPHHVP